MDQAILEKEALKLPPANRALLADALLSSLDSEKSRILEILSEAKKLAQEYHRLTGKPLGITGEVAEYEAARILGVKLTPARQSGYDAVEIKNGITRRLQIKGRCLLDNSKPGQQLGSIRIEKEWDAVLMVLLDKNFDAIEIYEAERKDVIDVLTAPGSKARNERGAMAVSKFKSIGTLRWPSHNTKPSVTNYSTRADSTARSTTHTQMNQREMMRKLLDLYPGNKARVIQEYAEAEQRGEVMRKRDNQSLTPQDYAARLFADGISKGWLRK